MNQPYQPKNSDLALQLAWRVVAATSIKEFAISFSQANLILNRWEWDCFIAECRRLKDESKQREDTYEHKNGPISPVKL